MTIVLFALIGANINEDVAYWLVYAMYCVWCVLKFINAIIEK